MISGCYTLLPCPARGQEVFGNGTTVIGCPRPHGPGCGGARRVTGERPLAVGSNSLHALVCRGRDRHGGRYPVLCPIAPRITLAFVPQYAHRHLDRDGAVRHGQP